MIRFLAVLAATTSVAAPPPGQISAFTVNDLVRVKRVSDPQVSPDGRYVAFVMRETDMEANRGRTGVWLLDLTQKNASPLRLTQSDANDSSPRWAPDSRTLYFLSARSGLSQVWRISLAGGEAARVTDYPLDIGSLKVSPDGNRIAVSMDVIPECADLRCSHDKLATQSKNKATSRVYDRLFIRQWDTWYGDAHSHLFVARINANGKADTPQDMTKTLDADVPSRPFGGDEEYDFSPDSSRLVFSARIAGHTEAWSTNYDLYEVPVDHAAEPKNLTKANAAWDAQPVFLKNGDLAYLAMDRPGFEADRFHVMVRDAKTGTNKPLTAGWDRSVARLHASADGKKLLVTADDIGQVSLFSIDIANGTPHRLVGAGHISDFSASKGSIVFAWENLGAPADLFAVPAGSSSAPRRLTEVNSELLGRRKLGEFERVGMRRRCTATSSNPTGMSPARSFRLLLSCTGARRAASRTFGPTVGTRRRLRAADMAW